MVETIMTVYYFIVAACMIMTGLFLYLSTNYRRFGETSMNRFFEWSMAFVKIAFVISIIAFGLIIFINK